MVEEDAVNVARGHGLALDVVADAAEGRHGPHLKAHLLTQILLEAARGDLHIGGESLAAREGVLRVPLSLQHVPAIRCPDEGGVAEFLLGPNDIEEVVLSELGLEFIPVFWSAAVQGAVTQSLQQLHGGRPNVRSRCQVVLELQLGPGEVGVEVPLMVVETKR